MATFSRSPVPALLLLLLAIAAVFPAVVRCGDGRPSPFVTPHGTYLNTHDHMDVKQLLKNDKLVTAYVKCILGEGRCTPEGQQVKEYLLPDIINTVCSRCSPRQKVMARQVMRHVYTTRRNDFDRIMALYADGKKYNEIVAFMNGSEQ